METFIGDSGDVSSEMWRQKEESLKQTSLTLLPASAFFFFWSGVTICRFVLHKNKAIHLPYVVSCKLRKKPQHSRGAPGGKVTYLPRPGSALPRRHPPLDSGGGFCLSPWHTMKCREHMLRVRWGLTKVKNGTAALIVSQHQ